MPSDCRRRRDGYKGTVRVRWLRRSLWVGAFACLWLNVLDDPPLVTGAYVQAVDAEAATIAMITDTPRRLACDVRDASGAVVATVREAGERRRHELRMTGLRPGAEHTYVVASEDGGEVDRGSFTTAPIDDRAEVRFAFLGDSGDLPPWIWLQRTPILHLPVRFGWLPDAGSVSAIGRAVANYGPDFVLHLGDVVYPRGLHAHYRSGFFRPFADVLRHAPVYAVPGNHDVIDCDGGQLLANFRPQPSEQTGDGRCFSFAWGPVRVIGLDGSVHRLGGTLGPDHPALAFLREQLASCTEPWIVVACHYPLRSQSRQRNRADLLLHLEPALREGHATVYLSGHDHCYQRFVPEPGEGPTLIVSGGGGKDLYEVRPDPRFVVESAFHWCSAEARGAALVVRAHRLDGTRIDTVEVRLPEGAELQRIRARNSGRADRIEALTRRR